jgi:uncharacterized protein YdaU (DUF1376 family)
MDMDYLNEELKKQKTYKEEINLPAMFVFVNNLISEMQDLELREAAAYVLLMLHMWRHGGVIEDNNKVIGRYLGIKSQKEVKKIKEKLAFKLIFFEGNITIQGLQKQHKDAVNKHKSKSKAGSIGGKISSTNRKNKQHNNNNSSTEIRQQGDVLLGNMLKTVLEQLE